MPSFSTLLGEGLAALNRGWVLTPLRGKRPLLSGWQTAPAPEIHKLRLWVARGCNLGVRAGPPSGVLVVDHDPARDDGTRLPALPRTVTARTGGGGHHYYFRCPEDPPGNSSGRVHPAIDIKCVGGQVVLPGSIHPDTGRLYAWAPGLDPASVPLAEVPVDLLATMYEPKPAAPRPLPVPEGLMPEVETRVERARAWLARVPGAISGERGHDRTFYVACRVAVGFDLDEATTLALLSDWNQTCEPSWSEKELRHKVTDALKKTDERGYMLADDGEGHVVPAWARAALTAPRIGRVVLPRRVSRRTIDLLNTGKDARYQGADGQLVGSRAVFAAAMSLLAAGLSEAAVARAICVSALRRANDRQGGDSARWLAAKVRAARRALERPRKGAS